jgi:hypothetical protein
MCIGRYGREARRMKFKEDGPFATPEAAERKLPEIANALEVDHAGRLSVAIINRQYRDCARNAHNRLRVAIGTFPTSRDARLESVMRTKADVRRSLWIYGLTP